MKCANQFCRNTFEPHAGRGRPRLYLIAACALRRSGKPPPSPNVNGNFMSGALDPDVLQKRYDAEF